MKKTYMRPEAEKIQFNYRDQVVAASAGAETPGVGSIYGNETWGSGGCKLYAFEAYGFSLCNDQ